MNLDNVSQKHLNELEHCVRELVVTMQKAKLTNDPLIESLRLLEQELEQARRQRYDASNTEYHTY